MLRQAVLLSIVLSSSVAAAAPKPLERVMAVLDGQVVCLSEVRARARPHIRHLTDVNKRPPTDAEIADLHKQLVVQIIDERIIHFLAWDIRLEVTDDEVERAIQAVAATSQITAKTLLEEVARMGMTEREYKDELRRQLLEAKWVNVDVRPTVPKRDDEKAVAEARTKVLERAKRRHYIEIRP